MAQNTVLPSSTSSQTEVIVENGPQEPVHIQLNLTEEASTSSRRVAFDETWVDNENLDKRKSKCCCIFTKQRLFDESSSEDDDDCPDHCHGKKGWHKKKKGKTNGDDNNDGSGDHEHHCDEHSKPIAPE